MLHTRRRPMCRSRWPPRSSQSSRCSGCTGAGKPLPLPTPSPTRHPRPGPSQHRVRADRRSVVEPAASTCRTSSRSNDRGMTFTNYTVTDSLCCPSRASIFTGEFPHDTQILRQQRPTGGFVEFQQRGEERSTFATSLLQRRLPDRLHGQVPQPVPAANAATRRCRQARYGGATSRRAGTAWDAVGKRLRTVRLHASTTITHVERHGHRPKDYLNTVLPAMRHALHRAIPAAQHKPVHARGRQLHPAQPVHPGAAGRRHLPGA